MCQPRIERVSFSCILPLYRQTCALICRRVCKNCDKQLEASKSCMYGPSVCMEQLGFYGKDFRDVGYSSIFKNSAEKIQVSLNSFKNNGASREDRHIFVSYLAQFFLEWEKSQTDSWIKRDQLDVTCFFISLFTAQHVSNVSTSILRSLRLTCWVISWVVLLWYDACCCYVVVWLGWCGIRMQASACVVLFFL